MWITKTSINQPVFATMVMLALVVLGLFSYRLLPVEEMPEISMPESYITVEYPGASPEAIEDEVIKPIENVINSIDGVRNMYATAREGRAFFQVEFRLETDVIAATQEIRDKVAQIRPTLPREVREPQIERANSESQQGAAVELVVYSGTRSLREVSTLVDQQIVKRLQNVAGVGHIEVGGSVQRQVQVYLRPEQLQSLRVGVDQVIAAIRAENQDLPAGSISRAASEQLVRVEGRIKDPRGFERIIVANQGGAPVYSARSRTSSTASRKSNHRARRRHALGLALGLSRAAGELVKVGAGVEEAIAELQGRLPEDVKIRTLWSDAKWIEGSIDRVKETIFEGALLTILIVFLFLHSWRSTVITGLTLPISAIATFTALHLFGFSLNFMTLMALSLCIGLLIDDAIVVRENIVRHSNMGKSHREAALQGTQEIGVAVMATTFAILAVFIPVAFMSGVIGRFFLQFGITVAVAVLVSLFVSFTLDPMLSSIWPDPSEGRFRRLPWLGRIMERVERVRRACARRVRPAAALDAERRRYARFFSPRMLLLAWPALTFFGSFMIVPLIGTEFVPQQDEGMVSMRLNTPIGSSLQYTDAKIRDAEAAIREIKGVEAIVTTVGTDEGKNYARLTVVLADRKTSKRPPQTEYENLIRERLLRMAGLTVSINQNNRPVSISLLGPDSGKLTELSQELMSRLAKVPGIADLESSEKGANPTIAVRINNELASDLGLTTAAIGNALRPLIAGDDISTWLGPDGQDYDVIVQLPKHRREIAADLGDLYVASSRLDANGSPLLVPLRQVAEFVETGSPQTDQAPQSPAPHLHLRERERPPLRRCRLGRGAGREGNEPAAGLSLRPERRSAGNERDVQCRAGSARPGSDLHLSRARVAVRQLHAAARDHGVAAAVAHRRAAGAVDHRHHAQHLLHHRLHHADGPGDEERDSARGLHQPGAAQRRAACTRRSAKPGRCACGRS